MIVGRLQDDLRRIVSCDAYENVLDLHFDHRGLSFSTRRTERGERRELAAKLRLCPVKANTYRRRCRTEEMRDLLARQVVDVVHQDDVALALR